MAYGHGTACTTLLRVKVLNGSAAQGACTPSFLACVISFIASTLSLYV
jgi:hypothetical protein